jgi:hypothetical protein
MGYSPEQYEEVVQDVGDIASAIVDDMNLKSPFE